jgi:serine/threonine protein phosphatase PrpC
LGGRVIFWGRWRVEGVLAVSRAIGDVNLKPYVTCDPEITTHTLTPDDQYLILASDGLWDVMSNEEVGTFITRSPPLPFPSPPVLFISRRISQRNEFQYLARDLCDEAILLGSSDNITVLVIDLRSEPPHHPFSPLPF